MVNVPTGQGTARAKLVGPTVVGLCAGIGAVGGSYALVGWSPAFVAGPVAGLLARRLPAAVITFAIVYLGDLGEWLSIATALGLVVILFGVLVTLVLGIGQRIGRSTSYIGAALAVTLAAYAITRSPIGALGAGVGAGVVIGVAALAGAGGVDEPSVERRRILAAAAGALGTVVAGGLLAGSRSTDNGEKTGLDLSPSHVGEITSALALANARSLEVDGLEPLVSDEFYRVDINATDPVVDADSWTLRVTGNVEQERTFTYDDIRAMEPSHRFVSLRCVGEELNGRKMDNALWTGVPIMPLVEAANPDPSCCVMFRAADGFYEEFPLSALADGFLAYGMNGELLPRAHGSPARALIPGHWGEINVKWLSEIEILETEAIGYWEERGWHGTGPVETVAKLHVENHLPDGRVEVAGHAYAGTRGVERVEVSTDGGGTWAEAELSEPLPGTDVWRQWVHRYAPPAGPHEVVVRAVDGTGRTQPSDPAPAFPNGPSGWVTRTVEA